METEKIGFFKRIKMAIFGLENYSIFADEKFSKALKYLFLLILIITTILAISSTIELSNHGTKLIEYIKSDELPNFELKDGKLEAESFLNAYDEEYNSRLIIDATEGLDDKIIADYKTEVESATYGIIFLKDKVIYKFDSTSSDSYETTYNNLLTTLGINELSKEKLVKDYLSNDNLTKLKVILFAYAFITVLLLNILNLIEDVIVIGLFGWIAAKIARVSLNISKAMSLAIYSLTLSIVLSTVYSVVYSFTNFEIKYFEVMYMIVAYIYIVAAIMIMKDTNKTAGEVVTVEGQVLKTGEEEEEKEEDKDEKEKKKEKEKLPKEKNKDKDKEEIPENQEENKEKGKE